jgi:Mrp family chromosome partitioning ATPase
MILSIEDLDNSVTHQEYGQILGRLEAARQLGGRGRVVAIAGCTSGDGATFVLRDLARGLAKGSRRGVLEANCADLTQVSRLKAGDLLAQCFYSRDAGLWQISAPGKTALGIPGESDLLAAVSVLSGRFDFVLLDCGPVNQGGNIWQVGPVVDDVFLVVAAGETRREQIAYAQRIVAQSGAHLSGCVLNKRTYPLPSFLHRLLS